MEYKPCPFDGKLPIRDGIDGKYFCPQCRRLAGGKDWGNRPIEDKLRRDISNLLLVIESLKN